MSARRLSRSGAMALMLAAASRTGAAQEPLRVLRFQPDSAASQIAPVVLTFDRPVAPNLDESVDPERLLTISPATRRHVYWRDPSTLVAEFTSPWPAGSTYDVRLEPSLRSADGRPLAPVAPWHVRVQTSRVLAVVPVGTTYIDLGVADPNVHLVVVYSDSVDTRELNGRLWFVPSNDCASRDSIPLTVVSTRRIASDDPYHLTFAGGYDRDQRLDSLRRVVELRASAAAPRGCRGALHSPTPKSSATRRHDVRIVPAFRLARIQTRSVEGEDLECKAVRCEAGPVSLTFSQPVSLSELQAHLRINGRTPQLAAVASGSSWALPDSLHAGDRIRIAVDGSLTSVLGERLAAPVDTSVVGQRSKPALGYAKGQVVLPRAAPFLLRVRYASADSIRIVIGRVADTARGRALSYVSQEWQNILWPKLIADSVRHVVAVRADSVHEQILDVPERWIPVSWRSDPLLVVRAEPVRATAAPPAKRDRVAHLAPVVVSADERSEPRFAVVQRSDLAAHAALRDEALDVWVTKRSSGAPLASARVIVFGQQGDSLATAVTNAIGIARIRRIAGPDDLPSLETRYAEVTLAGDRVLLALPVDPVRRVREGRAPADRGDLVAPRSSTSVMHGVAFADRGIYRPGEKVFVKGVARLRLPDAAFVVPRGDSVRWTLSFGFAGSDETIATRIGRLSEFGAQSDSFELPVTARAGWYRASLELRARGGWRSVANTQFAIAQYRVPAFAVHVTADTIAPLYAGDSATVRVSANYLFGPRMAGATVTAVAHVYDWSGVATRFPALEGYRVGRWDWFDDAPAPQQDPQPPPAKLGDDGTLEMRVPTRRQLSRPGTLSVSVEVVDANRQRVGASAQMPVRVTDAFVGIRTDPDRWDWTARKPVLLQLVTVRGDGTIRAGDTVKLVALRMSWTGGRWKRDTVWRDSVVSREQPVRTSFVPAVTGWYEIVASVRDAQGRTAESGTYVAVGGGDDWATRPTLSMRLDRRDASAGDTVNAIVEAPQALMAWVRLEQEGAVWERLTALKRGANVIRVPVPSPSLRFADVQLTAVRAVGPDTAAESASNVPYFFSAHEVIWVTDSTRALRVRLATDRERYGPRDTVHVSASVANRSGRGLRSEIAVWAVDEGVVSLTGYRRPELLADLLTGQWRPWWIWLSSTLLGTVLPTPPALGPSSFSYWGMRGEVTTAMAGMTLNELVSGGVPAPNIALRRQFATTPFFAGSVVTDSSGHATTSFVLPDNVTTYRLFAVAIDDDVRTGSADTTIVSTRPLVVRAALPRIVRTGDSLFAGAVLTREGEGRAPVELRVSTEGLRVFGEPIAHDTLVGARARERRFAMHVLGEDTVSVTFAAASESDRDAVLARLPVSVAGRPRAHVAMGSFRATGSVELDVPEGLDVARSRLVLRSGLSPMPLLRELDARLRVYPYACTEQLASMARALLARIRLERSLGDATTLTPDDRRRLELVTHEMLDRQRREGGFGYWSASNWTTPWLTSYVLDVLLGARELGVVVPQGALDKALVYLGNGTPMADYIRRTWLADADSVQWPHEALHAARMLRRLGHADTGLEAKVWAVRTKLDFEDRLTLALLQSESGHADVARKLVDVAWQSARVEGRRVTVEDSVVRRRWLFRSVTGATTALLRATTVTHPEHPLLGALLESVMQSARSDAEARWNTIDQAEVADAIAGVVAPLGLREGRRLTVTDPHGAARTIEIAPRGEDSLSLPLANYLATNGGHRSIRVELGSSSSTAPTYFALTLYEVPLARPVRADQEGIAVERWYERYDDGKPVVQVSEGDLVRVRLRITVPRDREFVVIDDALPAGLEAVDQSLRTTGSLPPYDGAARLEGDGREGPVGQRWLYGSWDGGWWTPWEHKEIRDDRVLYFARQLWRGSYQASYVARATTAGLFVRPPTQAEEMYNPAVHGRSDGGLFAVRSAPLPPRDRTNDP